MKSTEDFIIGKIYKAKNSGMTVLCMSQTKTGFGGKVITTFDTRAFEVGEIFNSFNKGSFEIN